MESLEESNCHSLSDSFSLYERYLRSFNVVDNIVEDNQHDSSERASIINDDYESSTSGGNIDLSAVYTNNLLDKQCVSAELQYKLLDPSVCKNIEDKGSDVSYINIDVAKTKSNSLQAVSLHDNSSITIERSLLNDQSEHTDIRFSSEDSKPEHFKQPIFITSTMENSNNAVDSVPMFRNIRPSENMFKLPITELSFNGTIKHVQKLKPIVDPITALSSNSALVTVSENVPIHNLGYNLLKTDNITDYKSDNDQHASSTSDDQNTFGKQNKTESIGNSQFEELNGRKDCPLLNEDGNSAKWNSEQSYSSLEASFDSGVRSPDMFSDEDVEVTPEPFWSFLKDYEFYDKKRVKKTELILQGVLPPPSVTVLKTDVTQMLKKYYCFLPAFSNDEKVTIPESNTVTPTKRVSFVHIPIELGTLVQETASENVNNSTILDRSKSSLTKNKNDSDMDVSSDENRGSLKTCTQIEAAQTPWPEVLKCRHYDIYYNTTKYSEQFECLALRFGERFVGAETDTSVSIHSGGLQSPSSASKRKALRLAQAKSPGRRLSHLARRRQTFCSAATISEKAQTTASKMVLIDKNFFPHRKLINTSERRSPRKLVMRRTPGKKTPLRKTPGKKTPAKTPKTKSGGSSRKKAMRRLLMDTENITRSQPTRESLKRALFVSPEGRRTVPTQPSTSVPLQAMKSKRALFGSPSTAETKSCDGIQSDQFLKRKRDALDDEPMNNRSKIAKSLSLGWDTVGTSQSFSLSRRASEVVVSKSMAELNDHHKQVILYLFT
ncbi:unnamed protein product [Diatraea saccharalis]|uniref:Uncharacterized protein n=1 Tax=Diatraea saccharalis TaxID=40085 RepID=A0A9P0C9X0_9NEOP|nr:unnamed protein product [Diatraea saccharalis]